jgi:hypothetical protein
MHRRREPAIGQPIRFVIEMGNGERKQPGSQRAAQVLLRVVAHQSDRSIKNDAESRK